MRGIESEFQVQHRLPLMPTPCLCHDSAELARAIAHAVRSLQYGTVELTIHEGRVVQLDRHEKIRWDRRAPHSTHTDE